MIYQLIGVAIILIAFVDVYLTVLYPRTGNSVISLKLSKATWELFRQMSRWPVVGSKNLLSYCGPTILVLTATLWVLAFALGFALLLWPALGTGIQASDGKTPTDFATALYYSGFALTTLGVGDLVPKTDLWRLVTVLEAAAGFSIITVSLTYLLSVYGALTQRNTFALSLHHRSGGKAIAAELLVRLKGYGKFEPAFQEISGIARGLLCLLESHHAYPILHYFRFQDAYYALARIALVSLDLATLIKTALHPQVYQFLIESAAVTELESGGLYMLSELADSFLDSTQPASPQPKSEWRHWYFKSIKLLQQHGIETVLDIQAGADAYVMQRSRWNGTVQSFASYMEYKWSEIAPDELAPGESSNKIS